MTDLAPQLDFRRVRSQRVNSAGLGRVRRQARSHSFATVFDLYSLHALVRCTALVSSHVLLSVSSWSGACSRLPFLWRDTRTENEMVTLILRWLGALIPVMLLVSFVVFLLSTLIPGDAAIVIAGGCPYVRCQAAAAVGEW